MSNENKIRFLYVQPGKYPEERFVANELRPFSSLSLGSGLYFFHLHHRESRTWHTT